MRAQTLSTFTRRAGAQARARQSEWLQPKWRMCQQPFSTQWSKRQSWTQHTAMKWYSEQIRGQWWWSVNPRCRTRQLQTAGNCTIKVPQVELDEYTFIHTDIIVCYALVHINIPYPVFPGGCPTACSDCPWVPAVVGGGRHSCPVALPDTPTCTNANKEKVKQYQSITLCYIPAIIPACKTNPHDW